MDETSGESVMAPKIGPTLGTMKFGRLCLALFFLGHGRVWLAGRRAEAGQSIMISFLDCRLFRFNRFVFNEIKVELSRENGMYTLRGSGLLIQAAYVSVSDYFPVCTGWLSPMSGEQHLEYTGVDPRQIDPAVSQQERLRAWESIAKNYSSDAFYQDKIDIRVTCFTPSRQCCYIELPA
jgi:hypothetical protein